MSVTATGPDRLSTANKRTAERAVNLAISSGLQLMKPLQLGVVAGYSVKAVRLAWSQQHHADVTCRLEEVYAQSLLRRTYAAEGCIARAFRRRKV
jgi:hypothetical protein